MSAIKIVDFTSGQSCATVTVVFYLQKWSGDWNQMYCIVTSVCEFRFVYTFLLKGNSEVKKMPSDCD